MKARGVFVVLFLHTLVTICVTVKRDIDTPGIIGKSKIELSPLLVSARLDDIIVISAPIVNKNTVYYLGSPNGDNIKLKLNGSLITTDSREILGSNEEFNEIHIKNIAARLKTIVTPNTRKILNGHYGNNCYTLNNDYTDQNTSLNAYDFVIGPLNENDHGNWVLSAYYRDIDKEWTELFQVISIEIIESLPTKPTSANISVGETFILRFAYSIKQLESCQITAPRSTLDRFYDRDVTHLDSCGYRIPNVTKEDGGIWRILAVGKIVYKGDVYLEIYD